MPESSRQRTPELQHVLQELMSLRLSTADEARAAPVPCLERVTLCLSHGMLPTVMVSYRVVESFVNALRETTKRQLLQLCAHYLKAVWLPSEVPTITRRMGHLVLVVFDGAAEASTSAVEVTTAAGVLSRVGFVGLDGERSTFALGNGTPWAALYEWGGRTLINADDAPGGHPAAAPSVTRTSQGFVEETPPTPPKSPRSFAFGSSTRASTRMGGGGDGYSRPYSESKPTERDGRSAEETLKKPKKKTSGVRSLSSSRGSTKKTMGAAAPRLPGARSSAGADEMLRSGVAAGGASEERGDFGRRAGIDHGPTTSGASHQPRQRPRHIPGPQPQPQPQAGDTIDDSLLRRGFKNPTGTTCYAAAILQVRLLQAPGLRGLFVRHCDVQDPVERALKAIVCNEVDTLSELALELRRHRSWDLELRQEDADEFWRVLARKRVGEGSPNAPWAPCCLFIRTRKHIVGCPPNHASSRLDSHETLMLALPTSAAVDEALQLSGLLGATLCTETVAGMICDGCHGGASDEERKKNVAKWASTGTDTKTLALPQAPGRGGAAAEPPEHIFFLIQRGLLNGVRQEHRVRADRLELAFSVESSELPERPVVKCATYCPTALVDHRPSTKGNGNTGHFTATVLQPDGQWWVYDDDRVAPGCVPSALKQEGSSTLYVVRYTKEETPAAGASKPCRVVHGNGDRAGAMAELDSAGRSPLSAVANHTCVPRGRGEGASPPPRRETRETRPKQRVHRWDLVAPTHPK